MRRLRARDPFAVWTGIWTALFGIVVAWNVSADQQRSAEARPDVVSLGGSVTEIVYALGEGHRLVARDTTSIYPAEALGLPDVGYMRRISPESVLSVGPGLVLSIEGAGPPEAIDVLKVARVPYVEVPEGYDADGVLEKIRVVGEALNVPEKSAALAADVAASLAEAKARVAAHEGEPRRVMFVLSVEGGQILAAGTGTAADAIIRLAGGVNALAAFGGYKTVGAEAITAAAPDVILMMDRGGNHSTSTGDLFDLPALQLTPAAESGALVRMNGLLLLGFGPRTAEAINDLSAALYN